MTRNIPNFFIIGAPKCGTTSLSVWLGEHSKVYMPPVKEPFFYSKDINHRFVCTWKEYIQLFQEAHPGHLAIGEASVFYLYSKVAVPAIERDIPDAQYIVMVRNPVDMAYSLHAQHLRRQLEDIEDFSEAWHLSAERRDAKCVPETCSDPILLDYQSWCMLGSQLQRLYTLVPDERVLVIVLDDIRHDPRSEYLRVLEFLGLPDDGRRHFPVQNPSGVLRSRWLASRLANISKVILHIKRSLGIPPWKGLGLIRRMQDMLVSRQLRPPLRREIRVKLKRFYEQDVQLLESLLKRDLSSWRQT